MSILAPTPLDDTHVIEGFTSGVVSLDDWLKRRARTNQRSGASRTYVTCERTQVIGYYSLASGAIRQELATGSFRRNMPDPIPVVILGRLAVDKRYQGQGIGRSLFRDSAYRIAYAADTLGIRGIVVHAVSEEAKAFYLSLGFIQSPDNPMTLMVSLASIRALLE